MCGTVQCGLLLLKRASGESLEPARGKGLILHMATFWASVLVHCTVAIHIPGFPLAPSVNKFRNQVRNYKTGSTVRQWCSSHLTAYAPTTLPGEVDTHQCFPTNLKYLLYKNLIKTRKNRTKINKFVTWLYLIYHKF